MKNKFEQKSFITKSTYALTILIKVFYNKNQKEGGKHLTRYVAFIRIIEYKSFTRAAESLGYTQAAVSQMIRTLEKELGITIFLRGRKEVCLTAEGQRLYPFIRKLVHSHDELISRAEEINGLNSGEIRIGTFSSMSQRLLPGVMNDFSKLYPGVQFVLSPGDNTTLPEQIKNGMIDFGFVYPEARSGLACPPICRDSFFAVFPYGHEMSDRKSVSLEEMAKLPLIIVDEGGVNTVLKAFEERGLTPNVKYRIHDDNTILSMVEKGLGVSILPSMILGKSAYRLITVPISTPVERIVGVAYISEELLSVSAKRFIGYLKENIDKYLPSEYLL